jgi:exopolysaccharide biosynthesis polyprenyl glycosylphosphotransferase
MRKGLMRKENISVMMPEEEYSTPQPNITGMLEVSKRIIDILGSLIFIVIFSPMFLIIAILIKIDSEGPVFFLQKRCGRGKKEFKMYKFRTMIKNAESLKSSIKNEVDGPMFKNKNDPRITEIGRFLRKWSLDEFPQLFNVLKGEMSLIGPRPLAKEEMTKNKNWMEMRLLVKPGMTGLWQVKGRASHRFSDWVKYDTKYVQNMSLLLDIKILFLTIPAVLRRNGAH